MKKYTLLPLIILIGVLYSAIAQADIDWAPTNPEDMAQNSSASICVTGGTPPYAWSIAGSGFSLAISQTNGLCNTVNTGETSCGSAEITVSDKFGSVTTGAMRSGTGVWVMPGAPYQGECIIPGPPTSR